MTCRIIEGDCLDVMATMDDGSVDAVVTDPPYGMGYRSNKRVSWARFEAIDNDATFDYDWQLAWIRETYRLLRDDAHFYMFCSDHHLGRFRDVVTEVGFSVKRSLVWVKDGFAIGDLHGDYAHLTEFILFAHKGRRALTGKRIGNVFNVPKIRPGDLLHPTEKPVGIVRTLIEKSTEPGQLVLDPFVGSGTTGVACKEGGRAFVGIEQDPQYVAVAEGRLSQGSLFEL